MYADPAGEGEAQPLLTMFHTLFNLHVTENLGGIIRAISLVSLNPLQLLSNASIHYGFGSVQFRLYWVCVVEIIQQLFDGYRLVLFGRLVNAR